jgi:hypothetical protein
MSFPVLYSLAIFFQALLLGAEIFMVIYDDLVRVSSRRHDDWRNWDYHGWKKRSLGGGEFGIEVALKRR